MSKKLNSLADLANLKFDDLAPDPKPQENKEIPFAKQQLEAQFSNKGRAGKTVTVIRGFDGDEPDLKLLGKTLKKAIGVGGSIKNGEIIIQGNYRDQLMKILSDMGHSVKRVGG
tara:strand:- start:4464 stop:4805 length:342 start_codon:yes stop_codon:yes gene_type:complete